MRVNKQLKLKKKSKGYKNKNKTKKINKLKSGWQS